MSEKKIEIGVGAKLDLGNIPAEIKSASEIMKKFDSELSKSLATLTSSIDKSVKIFEGAFNLLDKRIDNSKLLEASKTMKKAADSIVKAIKSLQTNMDMDKAASNFNNAFISISFVLDGFKGAIKGTDDAIVLLVNHSTEAVGRVRAVLANSLDTLVKTKKAVDEIFAEPDQVPKAKRKKSKVEDANPPPSEDAASSAKKVADLNKAAAAAFDSPIITAQFKAVEQVAQEFSKHLVPILEELAKPLADLSQKFENALSQIQTVARKFDLRLESVAKSTDKALTASGDRINTFIGNIHGLDTKLAGFLEGFAPKLRELKTQIDKTFADVTFDLTFNLGKRSLPEVIKGLQALAPAIVELKAATDKSGSLVTQLPKIGESITRFQDLFGKDRLSKTGDLATFGAISRALANLPTIVKSFNTPINTDAVTNLVAAIRKITNVTTEARVAKSGSLSETIVPAIRAITEAITAIPTVSSDTIKAFVDEVKRILEIGSLSAETGSFVAISTALTEGITIIKDGITGINGNTLTQVSSFAKNLNTLINTLVGNTNTANFPVVAESIQLGLDVLRNATTIDFSSLDITPLQTFLTAMSTALRSLDTAVTTTFEASVRAVRTSVDALITLAGTTPPDLSNLERVVTEFNGIVSQLNFSSTVSGDDIREIRDVIGLFGTVATAANRIGENLAEALATGVFANISAIMHIFSTMPVVSTAVIGSAENVSLTLEALSVGFRGFSILSASQLTRLNGFLAAIPTLVTNLAHVSTATLTQATHLSTILHGLTAMSTTFGTTAITFPALTLPRVTVGSTQAQVQQFANHVTALNRVAQFMANVFGPAVTAANTAATNFQHLATALGAAVTSLSTIRAIPNLAKNLTNIVNAVAGVTTQIVTAGSVAGLVPASVAIQTAFQNIAAGVTALRGVPGGAAAIAAAGRAIRRGGGGGAVRPPAGGGGAGGPGGNAGGQNAAGGQANNRFLGLFNNVREILPTRGSLVQFTGTLFLLEGAIAGIARAFDRFKESVIGTNVELEQITITLATTLGTTERASEAINGFARTFAQNVPFFDFKDITDSIALLSAEGFSLAKLTGNLDEKVGKQFKGSLVTALADQAAAFGTSLNESVDAFVAATQGRFVKIRKFGISESLLKSFGFSGLRSDAEGLANTLERIINVRFGGLLKTLSKTFKGATSNIDELFTNIRTRVASGLFDIITKELVRVADALNDLTGKSAKAKQFGNFLDSTSRVLAGFTNAGTKAIRFIVDFKEVFLALVSLPIAAIFFRTTVYGFQRLTESVGGFMGIIRVAEGPNGISRLTTPLTGIRLAIEALFTSVTARGAAIVEVFQSIFNVRTALVAGLRVSLMSVVTVFSTFGRTLFLLGTAFTTVFKLLAIPLILETIGALSDLQKGLNTPRVAPFKNFLAAFEEFKNEVFKLIGLISDQLSLMFNIGTSNIGALQFATQVLAVFSNILQVITEVTRAVLNVANTVALALGSIVSGISNIFSGETKNAVATFGDQITNAFNPNKIKVNQVAMELKQKLADEINKGGIKIDLAKAVEVVNEDSLESSISLVVTAAIGTALASAVSGLFTNFAAEFSATVAGLFAGGGGAGLAAFVATMGGLAEAITGVGIAAGIAIPALLVLSKISFDKDNKSADALKNLIKGFDGLGEELKKSAIKNASDSNFADVIAGKITDPKEIEVAFSSVESSFQEGLDRIDERIKRKKAEANPNFKEILGLYELKNATRTALQDLTKFADGSIAISKALKENLRFDPGEGFKKFNAEVADSSKALNAQVDQFEKAIQRSIDALGSLQEARSEALLNDNQKGATKLRSQIDKLTAQILESRNTATDTLIKIRNEAQKSVTSTEKAAETETKKLDKIFKEQFDKIKRQAKDAGVVISDALIEEFIKNSAEGGVFGKNVQDLKLSNKVEIPTELITNLREAGKEFLKEKTNLDSLEKSADEARKTFNAAEQGIQGNAKAIENFISTTLDDIKAQRELGQTSATNALIRVNALNEIRKRSKAVVDNVQLERDLLKEQVQAVRDYAEALKLPGERLKALGSIDPKSNIQAATTVLRDTLSIFDSLGERGKNIKEVQEQINVVYTAFRDTIDESFSLNKDNLDVITKTATELENIRNTSRQSAAEFDKFGELFAGFDVRTGSVNALKEELAVFKDIQNVTKDIASANVESRGISARVALLQQQIASYKAIGKELKQDGFAEKEIVDRTKEVNQLKLDQLKIEVDKRDKLKDAVENFETKRLELLKKQNDLVLDQEKAVDAIIEKRKQSSEGLLSAQEKLLKAITGGNLPIGVQRNFALARIKLLQNQLETTTDPTKREAVLNEFIDLLGNARKEQLITEKEFTEGITKANSEINSLSKKEFAKEEIKRASEISAELTSTRNNIEAISNSIGGMVMQLQQAAVSVEILFNSAAETLAQFKEFAGKNAMDVVEDIKKVLKEKGLSINLADKDFIQVVEIAKSLLAKSLPSAKNNVLNGVPLNPVRSGVTGSPTDGEDISVIPPNLRNRQRLDKLNDRIDEAIAKLRKLPQTDEIKQRIARLELSRDASNKNAGFGVDPFKVFSFTFGKTAELAGKQFDMFATITSNSMDTIRETGTTVSDTFKKLNYEVRFFTGNLELIRKNLGSPTAIDPGVEDQHVLDFKMNANRLSREQGKSITTPSYAEASFNNISNVVSQALNGVSLSLPAEVASNFAESLKSSLLDVPLREAASAGSVSGFQSSNDSTLNQLIEITNLLEALNGATNSNNRTLETKFNELIASEKDINLNLVAEMPAELPTDPLQALARMAVSSIYDSIRLEEQDENSQIK